MKFLLAFVVFSLALTSISAELPFTNMANSLGFGDLVRRMITQAQTFLRTLVDMSGYGEQIRFMLSSAGYPNMLGDPSYTGTRAEGMIRNAAGGRSIANSLGSNNNDNNNFANLAQNGLLG